MLHNIRDLFIIASLMCFSSSCMWKVEDTDVIYVNLTKASLNTIKVDDYPYVLLQSPNLIGTIDRIQFDNEKLLLKTGRDLAMFITNGTFCGYVSHFGRSNNEFLSILDFWFDDNGVCLYDMNGKKILTFDTDGNYIDSFSLTRRADEQPFQLIIPIGKQYVGKRMYNGLPGYPELALYNDVVSHVKDINASNIHLRSGIYFGSQFARYSPKSVLYNRSFDNKIYEVTCDTAVVRYIVDFGARSIDVEKYKDEYEILDKINEKKYGYSTLIDNMEYDNGLMSFSYAYTGDKNGYRVAVYDNKSKSTWNYAFVSDEQIACACMHESMIYVFTQTPDGQTRLYRIPFVKDAIHQLKE